MHAQLSHKPTTFFSQLNNLLRERVGTKTLTKFVILEFFFFF